MKKALTEEEKKKFKPKMGKRIISDMQAAQIEGRSYKDPSFLDDTTISERSMDDTYDRPVTKEMMEEAVRRNHAERAAEYASMGRTGKEAPTGDLPPMNFVIPPRIDTSESESESDKENEPVDESMEAIEREEEKEKEADETTPIAQQRSLGLAESGSPAGSVAGPAHLSTTPVRPDSGFKKPRMPAGRGGPPRHSTPKMNARPRDSLGAAFNNISIIGPNTSVNAPPTERSGASTSTTTRKESTGSSRGGPVLGRRFSIEEEDEEGEEAEEAVPANGTFVIDRPAEDAAAAAADAAQHNGTYLVEGEEEREGEQQEEQEEEEVQEEEDQEPVQVHVESVVMRRQSVAGGRARLSVASMEGVEEEEEEVAVVGVAMRRVSARPQDVTMMSIDEGGEESDDDGGRDRREESQEMDDVEMASAYETPVRRKSIRPAKRPSMEHPLNDTSSPMAVAMARRNSGLRDAMVRPKVSVVSMAGSTATAGRKVSTGSVSSSIPFEDLSRRSNLSMDSSEGQSYVEPKTPERTPRTTRLLRESIAARDQRQSQLPQQRLPILEEAEMQGGGGSEDEEEEEEMDEDPAEMRGLRRGSATPTTPVHRLPRLSAKLQSSVDRLSQPRHHRHSPGRPCARAAASPTRAATPLQRGGARPSTSMASPSPAHRLHANPLNASRGVRGMMAGYTPNQRVDTTLMEDEGGAKSGLAPRIKRIPRREQPTKAPAVLLDVSVEQSDVEDMRRQAARNPTLANASVDNSNQSKETSAFTDAPTATPITSAITSPVTSPVTTPITSPAAAHHRQYDDHSFDYHEEREEDFEGEDGEERGEEGQERGGDAPDAAAAAASFDDSYDFFNPGAREEGEEREGDGEEEEQEEEDEVFETSAAASVGGASSAASAADDSAVFVRPANPLPATPRSGGGSRRSMASHGSRRSMFSDSDANEDVDRLSSRASQISIDSARRAPAAAAAAASLDGSFDIHSPGAPRPPQTPFRALQARERDLFSTDTPGVHSHRTNSYMSTTEEESWAANQSSRLWRGNVPTDQEENEGEADDSQLSPEEMDDGEVEEVKERVLAPRKLIAPTASPGVRRSTRTRMKPVRTWLGEQPQYQFSPSGGRRLVGVNEVVIKDKIFVKAGTADMEKAVLAKNQTAKQRAIANKKRKEQKGRERAVLSEEEDSE